MGFKTGKYAYPRFRALVQGERAGVTAAWGNSVLGTRTGLKVGMRGFLRKGQAFPCAHLGPQPPELPMPSPGGPDVPDGDAAGVPGSRRRPGLCQGCPGLR